MKDIVKEMTQEQFLSNLRKIGLFVAGGLGVSIVYKSFKSKKTKYKAGHGNTYFETEFEEK
ncbi:hypothetical protein [Paenibacillus sp. LPE1-1-1.1]|uniref:hypothetical protein n=1 Tax=Paenibacillus sp. LPE1-1-1.1 TaxID=3135230 RepID=UPI0034404AC0